MDERTRFVIRLKDGEGMASLCREFGISRKTGYKIFERYEECGLEGLSDLKRRPSVFCGAGCADLEPPAHRVITCKSATEARAAMAAALRILEQLGVQLNPEKTRIVHVRFGFEFLG